MSAALASKFHGSFTLQMRIGQKNQKFLGLIGKPLFEIAEWGIHATDHPGNVQWVLLP